MAFPTHPAVAERENVSQGPATRCFVLHRSMGGEHSQDVVGAAGRHKQNGRDD
jgi:hypothetical protein